MDFIRIYFNIYHARDLPNVTWNAFCIHTHTHTHTRYYAVYFTYADEHSLEKGSHRFHALCAKVNRRGKRKLPVILTGTKVQPPTTKTTKKLENPRSAAARFVGARSRRKRSNGTGGSYRRSFTRMHNYPVSWRTSSTRVSIAALSRVFFFSSPSTCIRVFVINESALVARMARDPRFLHAG